MDLDGQLTFADSPLTAKFNEGLENIQTGNFEQTLEIMEEIFDKNPDFTGVVETIKSIKFWQNRVLKMPLIPQGQERANYLFQEWSNYLKFTVQSDIKYKKILLYLKNFIFKNIIKNLVFSYQQSDVPNIEILFQIGEIFINIEEYRKAVEAFEYARMFRKKDGFLLSLLADAYYKLDKIDKSQILFREAFLHDPQNVNLSKIKADFIHEIKEEIEKDMNISSELLLEWIPVYGILLNKFKARREISSDELSRFIQEVQELENDYHTQKFINERIEPKIINRYLWLLDYYSLQNKNKDYIKIYLNKLKDINKAVYEKYSKIIEKNFQ